VSASVRSRSARSTPPR